MKKVLIANRGEIACRIARSCRELDLATVAVYSEADRNALHVKMMDEAVAIGEPPPLRSYLDAARILQAAERTGADAIHPGYGFLSENAEFARGAEAAGLTWVGPTPDDIDAMGDKERARHIAQAAGVPVLPGSRRFGAGDVRELEQTATAVGFPLLVKAAAGGGGIGMRVVKSPGALRDAVESTQQMAARAFGDGTVYLERFIESARHVEVQVFGFGDGRALHVFERDCSIQRRFQKIVEESPAPGLPPEVRQRMLDAAVALTRSQRYRGAGTVEFVMDSQSFEFFFLEMNTRIQVEHPVSEMVAGVDLVKLQLQLAAGVAPILQQSDLRAGGHAIECRLYAERPAKGFLPSCGTLSTLRLPETGKDLRVDCGLRSGDAVTHHYDPLVAKIIAHGASRAAAIDRMLAALAQLQVEGVETNCAFLQRVLTSDAYSGGTLSTDFVDRHRQQLLAP